MLNKIKYAITTYLTLEKLRQLVAALGGRRFLLSLGAGAIPSLLVWGGFISDVVYRDIILGTVGAYIAGNTIQKGVEIKAKAKGE